jgi:hypothetical protein
MRWALVLLAIAGCKMDPAPPHEIAPTPAPVPEPPRDAAPPDVSIDAPRIDTDETFRADVRAFATREGQRRRIRAWGTLHLDGSAKRYRFAILDVIVAANDTLVPGSAGTGVYLIEQDANTFWAIAFWWGVAVFRVDPIVGDPPGEPPWMVSTNDAFEHAHNHNHGGARARFALRGGRFVVLYEWDENTRREPVDTIVHDFDDGTRACKQCPPLARHRFPGTDLMLWWPAHSIAQIRDLDADAFDRDDSSLAPGPEVRGVL